MSTAFHPQTDGQTERANRTLEDMLRAFVGYRQDDWEDHLAAAEFACNNAPNASTGLSPFRINYGKDPHNPYTSVNPIPDEIPATTEFLQQLSNKAKQAADALVLAKANQERNANHHRRDVTFCVGDLVLLSSHHINLASQATRPSKKLQHRFTGPYRITQKVSPVAFKLALPDTLKIHPVFHVSLLRQYRDPTSIPNREAPQPPPPAITINDHPEFEVEKILDHRTHRRQKQYLVKWVGYPDHDASWEPVSNLANASRLVSEYEALRTMPGEGGDSVMESQVSAMSRDQSRDTSGDISADQSGDITTPDHEVIPGHMINEVIPNHLTSEVIPHHLTNEVTSQHLINETILPSGHLILDSPRIVT
jgi:hypothetical protein